MRESLYSFCMRTGKTELLDEWDEEKNGSLTPEVVTSGSSRRVWWRCPKGHTWQADVFSRAKSGTGCPSCGGKRVIPGENDLAARFPDVAGEWHPTKNGSLRPEDVLPGSHKLVWWLCPHGHEWRAMVKSRTAGCGCPVCANRLVKRGENDLATTHPGLAAQWNAERNGSVTPQMVTAGSHRKVWWNCPHGHEWRASVLSRAVNGAGCPVCAGKVVIAGFNDLASAFPEIAAEWHPTKNGALRADGIQPYSNRKVWWRCPLGHEYQAVIAARTTHGSGCPYCAGRKVLAGFNDLATMAPDTAGQWHPTLNGSLTPQMITAGARRKVWWICPEGHVWKAAVYSRTGACKSGCPVCAGVARRRRGIRRACARSRNARCPPVTK